MRLAHKDEINRFSSQSILLKFITRCLSHLPKVLHSWRSKIKSLITIRHRFKRKNIVIAAFTSLDIQEAKSRTVAKTGPNNV